ncbi:uncharacterized protein LOC135086591 [Ostrinia nubilalis]|uniref:uncharacterized protein LOC114358473 n=1 Tax=Ostrinia furnacalis TaxID=93504 RepID=UPI00103A8EB4|nr:uncharacterized protein LOC114358473 [Ostrinia furnacalis]
MIGIKNCIVYCLLLSVTVFGKHKKAKPKKFVSPTTKGIQCYNCLSFDHPGCWDPDHPDYANITVPNIDCYIPGMAFLCIVITSESAKLVETGQEIGPVRARTCVPAKDFSKKTVSYSMCSKLSKELSASEIFSRIAVSRPQCTLCKKHLCTDASHC